MEMKGEESFCYFRTAFHPAVLCVTAPLPAEDPLNRLVGCGGGGGPGLSFTWSSVALFLTDIPRQQGTDSSARGGAGLLPSRRGPHLCTGLPGGKACLTPVPKPRGWPRLLQDHRGQGLWPQLPPLPPSFPPS